MLIQIVEPKKFTPERSNEGKGAGCSRLRLTEQLPDEELIFPSNRTLALVLILQEMVTKLGNMCQALNSCVEVTRISTVAKASHSLKKECLLSFKMINALYNEWSTPINLYKERPNVEIEWRLGRTGRNFDTNVGKETFDKLMHGLQKYTGWEQVREEELTVYYGPKGSNKRVSINEKTDEQVAIKKKSLAKADFPLEDRPFDIRLAVSTEEPCEWGDDTEASSSKTKHRWSFVRKNLSIDMSIMKGDPDDKDCDEDTTYHVEFEIVDPTKVTTRNELFNMLQKTFDLMKLI
jgi:hypothetical protein